MRKLLPNTKLAIFRNKMTTKSTVFVLLVLSLVLASLSQIGVVQATTYNIIVEVSSPLQNKTYFTNDIPLSFNYSTNIPNLPNIAEYSVVFCYNLDGEPTFDMFGNPVFWGKTTRIGQFYQPIPLNHNSSIHVPNGNHSLFVFLNFWITPEGESQNTFDVPAVSQVINFTVSAPEFPSESTIYIRANGSVEGTDKIRQEGNIYTFTENINGTVVIEKDNIVVDGTGFILQGTGSFDWIGVDISSRNNVTVNNLLTRLCGYDVFLSDSSNCVISNISIEDFLPNDIYLENSSNNIISGTIGGEIKLYESDGNILLDNLWSLKLFTSVNNTISGNGNSIELSMSLHNTISKNNSSIRLFSESNGNGISENIGFIGLWGSSNNSIIGNNGAILIVESHNNTIIQNIVENNSPYGIQLGYSSGNIFSENIIQNNKLDIRFVVNNTFYHNDFVNVTIELVEDSIVFWDDDGEGNYWDDYTGLDTNGNGIGNTPYIIDENNQDNYPLMVPNIIPEFQLWIILPLFLVVTFVAVLAKKRLFQNAI